MPYLVQRKRPTQIIAAQPRQKEVWESMVGVSGDLQYGRPAAFHQQAQQQSWAAAWSRLNGAGAGGVWRERLVRGGPRLRGDCGDQCQAYVVVRIPGLDHHFTRYNSTAEAFADKGGPADADAALNVMLPWLAETFAAAAVKIV